jgi:hypothetical protein
MPTRLLAARVEQCEQPRTEELGIEAVAALRLKPRRGRRTSLRRPALLDRRQYLRRRQDASKQPPQHFRDDVQGETSTNSVDRQRALPSANSSSASRPTLRDLGHGRDLLCTT